MTSERDKRCRYKKLSDILQPSLAAGISDSCRKDDNAFEVNSRLYVTGRHGGVNTNPSAGATNTVYVNGTTNLLNMDGHVQNVRNMSALYPGYWSIEGIRDTSM